jgi:hypothetical protein
MCQSFSWFSGRLPNNQQVQEWELTWRACTCYFPINILLFGDRALPTCQKIFICLYYNVWIPIFVCSKLKTQMRNKNHDYIISTFFWKCICIKKRQWQGWSLTLVLWFQSVLFILHQSHHQTLPTCRHPFLLPLIFKSVKWEGSYCSYP